MRETCFAVGLGLLLAGCTATPEMPAGDPQLSYAYAQLHDLMKRQSGASNLLILRDVADPTKKLIQRIAKTADQAKDKLEQFAQRDRRLVLTDTGLPEIEADVRSAIAAATARQLLTGDHIERNLLMAQIRATQYARHLAATLAEADPNADRSEYLKQLSKEFQTLNGELATRLSPK